MNLSPNQWNAFIPGQEFSLKGQAGLLSSLRLAVKDLFNIAGHPTSAGNPDFLKANRIPEKNAPVIDQLLNAGAEIVGKTITEEMAYSLVGENIHYGTPKNPHNPECIPGGSSSGSAVATAANLCDIGLGTDTAGSIRLPASFCGLWGLRTSHDVISSDGVVPLAPSFDSVGWMARDWQTLNLVGGVLLPKSESNQALAKLKVIFPENIWGMIPSEYRDLLAPQLDKVSSLFPQISKEDITREGLLTWQNDFRIVQGYEAWAVNKEWITQYKPHFGPGIKDRFEWASTIVAADFQKSKRKLEQYALELDELLSEHIVCIPSVPYLAPLKGQASSDQDRTNALCALSLASIGGLPQVSMPLAKLGGRAFGISLMSRKYSDLSLLNTVRALSS